MPASVPTTMKLEIRREAKQRRRRAALVIVASAVVAFLLVRGGDESSPSADGGSRVGPRRGGVAWGGGEAGGGMGGGGGSRPLGTGGGGAIGDEDDDGGGGGGGGRRGRHHAHHGDGRGRGGGGDDGGEALRRALSSSGGGGGTTSFGATVRVFVYTQREVPEIAKLAPERGCKATREEQLLHHLLLQHPTMRTTNQADATHFFLPSYPECLLQDSHHNMSPAQYSSLVTAALARMPAFRRSGGLDHVLMAPPRGIRHAFPAWRRHAGNCLFFTPEPVAGNGYGGDVFREMVVPGPTTRREVGGGGGSGGSGGGGGGGGGGGLLTVLGDGSGAKELRAALGDGSGAGAGAGDGDGVYFCVVAAGDRGWSTHLAAAAWRGCVPVVIIPDEDKHAPRLPLEDVLDYSTFSLRVPHAAAIHGGEGGGGEGGGGGGGGGEGLVASLRGVGDDMRRRLARGLAEVRCAFVYPSGGGGGRGGGGGFFGAGAGAGAGGVSCSAAAAVEAQLARRVLSFPRTSGVFWNHNGTIHDADRVPYSAWGGLAPFPTEDVYTYAPKGADLEPEC